MLRRLAIAFALFATSKCFAQETYQILAGHHGKITSMAFSNKNQTLLSRANDNSVRVWNLKDLRTATVMSKSFQQEVVFSPDGKYLAYCPYNYSFNLMDAESETIIGVFKGHHASVSAISFSANGELVASGSLDKTINIWDTQTTKLIKTLYGYTTPVDALAFSSDGAYLASGGHEKTIKIWDVEKGTLVKNIPNTSNGVISLFFTFDRRNIISYNSNHSVKLLNIHDGNEVKTFSEKVTAVTANDRYLVLASSQGYFELWSLETLDLVKRIWTSKSTITSLSMASDSKSIAVGEQDGTIRYWNISHLVDGEKSDLRFPPLLTIKDKSIVFSDTDGNNRLDAGENATIEFVVVNQGKGAAKGLRLVPQLMGASSNDIYIYPSPVHNMDVNTEQTVSVILKAGMHTSSGKAFVKLVVAEANGLDSPPVEVEFNTLGFLAPKLVVADGVFSSETGNTIKPNYPVNLELLVQNVGVGSAEGISLEVKLPSNVLNLDPVFQPIDKLMPGESVKLKASFIITARYTAKEVPIKIIVKEKLQMYGSEKDFVAHVDQVIATNYVSVQGQEFKKVEVTPASLRSLVDQDIPVNGVKSDNRYALVIGNENYQQFQTGLKNDQNVAYARNDAIVFKEYLVKTMGFPDNHVFLFTDATRAQISRQLERLTELAKLNPGTELVFYYAGHGLPDQESREGYLIPVDVTASDIKEGIALKEMFAKLASANASKVVVFLDACFSGGGRGENGLLAARTVRVKPKGDIIAGNIIAFTAASGEEVSLPYNQESHGLFTYYLLKKLKETKGNVSMDELRNYLESELPKASLLENSLKQTPQLLIAPDLGDTWIKWTF